MARFDLSRTDPNSATPRSSRPPASDGAREDAFLRADAHRRAGRRRVLARAGRAGAARGATVGLAIGAGVHLVLRGFSIGPWIAAGIVGAAIVATGAVGTGLARHRARSRSALLWERAVDAAPPGLLVTAAAVIARRDGSPFARACLVRAERIPVPASSQLTSVLPGPTHRSLAAGAVLLLGALLVAPALEGRGRSLLPGSADPAVHPAGTVPVGTEDRRRDPLSGRPPEAARREVDTLRSHLAHREELAALLGDAAALDPLAAVLREGGALPELGELSPTDRARLRRAATRARDLGETAIANGLDTLAAGTLAEPAETDLELTNAAARLAEVAGAWERGGSPTEAEATIGAPPEVPGGERAGSRGDRPTPPLDEETVAGDATEPLPEGLPLGPGSGREGTAPGPVGTAAFDPSEAWLRRPELEPRWFPVIEAYRRGGGPR